MASPTPTDGPEAEWDVLADEEAADLGLPVADARFALTRPQVEAFVETAREAVSAGRRPCPLCGRPLDPEGHACPRLN